MHPHERHITFFFFPCWDYLKDYYHFNLTPLQSTQCFPSCSNSVHKRRIVGGIVSNYLFFQENGQGTAVAPTTEVTAAIIYYIIQILPYPFQAYAVALWQSWKPEPYSDDVHMNKYEERHTT